MENHDIVGIVKELQEKAMKAEGFGWSMKGGGTETWKVPYSTADYLVSLKDAFPTLARSLLVAMEALEWYDQPHLVNSDKAKQALAAIRSPNPNDHQQ